MESNSYSDLINFSILRVSDNEVNVSLWLNNGTLQGQEQNTNKRCLVYDFLIEAVIMGCWICGEYTIHDLSEEG